MDYVAEQAKNFVRGGNTPPPNAPATIVRKGKDSPLVDTGDLPSHIVAKVLIDEKKGTIEGNLDIKGNDEVQTKAWTNEYGYPSNYESTDFREDQKIPTRSFLRKAIDMYGDQALENALNAVGDELENLWNQKRRR